MSEQRKKLIEVALPLEAINKASRDEKRPFTKNHPRALHVWWARRPLAACRAVLFASLVDDPSSHPEKFPTEEAQERERQRLFRIIEDLVKWGNSTNEQVLSAARAEILTSTGGNPPPVLDPFCGGGSIPLEAQRLGLEAYASDLNPVAVLITKALVEIPPKFAGRSPVNPEARKKLSHSVSWAGAQGLSEDVRYYGRWMRDEAQKRIGHLYPRVDLPKEHGGGAAAVIAWLWARTAKCPNPACGAEMPLVRSFWLSTKEGKEAWVKPVVDKLKKTVRFEVKGGVGAPPDPPKIGRGAKFRCVVCGEATADQHIKNEGHAKRLGTQLLAIVAQQTQRGRIYLPPTDDHVSLARQASPSWKPEGDLADDPRNLWCVPYGFNTFGDLFTPRQLVALTTFSDLVGEARERVLADAKVAAVPDDGKRLNDDGTGATAYADAVTTILGIAVSRFTDFSNSICSWDSGNTNLRQLFVRQAIPMAWDYVETNPLDGVVSIVSAVEWAISALQGLGVHAQGYVRQLDAAAAVNGVETPLISTDPPYYDNIGYADLSDFFYIWLRRTVGNLYPALFSTLLVPKAQELVATPYRFGGDKEKARKFFETGLRQAFTRMRETHHPDYPLTLFYAFKQAESDDESSENDSPVVASTGWETMLTGLLDSRFIITGTWPMRTEQQQRSVAAGTNALASSIVLVCRPRPDSAPLATRKEFVAVLKKELPAALKKLQHGNIAPVDLAQAAIGPGMAVFSRYGKVVEADGSKMATRTALALINQVLDETLMEQEGEFDSDTRWAAAWFTQYGMAEGPYGEAETLSTAKNTSVGGLVDAGILSAKGGKARLLRRDELSDSWDPMSGRVTAWEVTQRLTRALEKEGESAAAALRARLGGVGEIARDLAYRLYSICERKNWAQDALAYNSLVIAWPEILRLAAKSEGGVQQSELFT
jgi:putative DNA methylase